MTFTIEPPTQNYIPVVWGLIGFGLYGFLFWKTWIELSRILINQHKDKLIEMRIAYHDNRFKKTVDMYDLLHDRNNIGQISSDVKSRLSYYTTFFRLTAIAFPVFVVLGILTAILT